MGRSWHSQHISTIPRLGFREYGCSTKRSLPVKSVAVSPGSVMGSWLLTATRSLKATEIIQCLDHVDHVLKLKALGRRVTPDNPYIVAGKNRDVLRTVFVDSLPVEL